MNDSKRAATPEPPLRRRARPQAVAFSEMVLTKTRTLSPELTLPLVIEPAIDNVDLVAWARDNSEYLDRELLKHGALLLRGFETNLDVFEAAAGAVSKELFRDYGDLPQEQGKDAVYHSTPYPENEMIDFHNESSHLRSWPEKQFFMCVLVSEEGGVTPIADCREVYRLLSPELRDKFHSKGLKYVRNFIPKLDVSWQQFFRTENRAEVEAKCRETGTDFTWKDGDRLKIESWAPGVITHPRTGELVFFNQVRLHHVSCLPAAYRESTLSMFAQDDLPRNVVFGDGTPITDDEIAQVGLAFDKAVVDAPWQKGDIMMLNNMLVAHGRRPFKGKRKIVVAMADMWKVEDVQSRPKA
ncbi:MAG TPA: TauD/TfdA family dioxygenase [Vicinamibacterales bacterium]|nr:TauD/TfdA family dioxygenase [Vicinamibacterales bacterium]